MADPPKPDTPKPPPDAAATPVPVPAPATTPPETVPEVGGRKGPDPTRYGDWEKDGRCVDF